MHRNPRAAIQPSSPRKDARRIFIRGTLAAAGLLSAGLATVSPAGATTSGPHSAVVDYGGALVRGMATQVINYCAGRYDVLFKNDVSRCAYTATVADPANALVFNPATVFTAGGHAGPRSVYVETENPGGGLQEGVPFHLNVNC